MTPSLQWTEENGTSTAKGYGRDYAIYGTGPVRELRVVVGPQRDSVWIRNAGETFLKQFCDIDHAAIHAEIEKAVREAEDRFRRLEILPAGYMDKIERDKQ